VSNEQSKAIASVDADVDGKERQRHDEEECTNIASDVLMYAESGRPVQ